MHSHISFQPHIAVLTNVLADHLDRYNGFSDYAASEKLIYKNQAHSDFLITNQDNPVTRDVAHDTQANIYWFSIKDRVTQGTYLEDDKLFFKSGEQLTKFFSVKDIPLPGVHNISNILAAANAFFIYGLPLTSIQNGIKTFPGVPNRLEKIKTLKGVNFYNDTCATTPDSTIAAINSFPEKPLILILGGGDKKLNYDELCKTIKEKDNIIYIAILKHPEYNASEIIREKLQGLKMDDRVEICSSMYEAVNKAYQKAIPGTNIILSPAATSFGMFSNEFERGNVFRQVVSSLI